MKTYKRPAFARPWMAALLFAGACAPDPLPDQPQPDTSTEAGSLTLTTVKPIGTTTLVARPLPPPPPPAIRSRPRVLALERGTDLEARAGQRHRRGPRDRERCSRSAASST